MTTFLTSDLHFGHAKIIGYCDRPFATREEMDEALVENWNKTVKPSDEVIVIGDFSFYGADKTREISRRLQGKKTLILGNHDWGRSEKFWNLCGFDIVLEKTYLDTDLGPVFVQHYPTYDDIVKIQFHGHVHNRWKAKKYVSNERVLVNFSVEKWNYAPVAIEEAYSTVRLMADVFDTHGITEIK
jgi:calcineurin-like phosphoesterase family protein